MKTSAVRERGTGLVASSCHDPVAENGAALLDDLVSFLGRFIAYPRKLDSDGNATHPAQIAHALWIAHTHCMEACESTPRIAFLSPEPGSGKTRALEISELLVPNPVEACNVSTAYLFRRIGVQDEGLPTILFDEVDAVFSGRSEKAEEIRGIINAGHRRGAKVGRCVMQAKMAVTQDYPVFCALALAGLGWLPDTLMSRSILIRMRRRAHDEIVEPYRRRDHEAEGHTLRDRLTQWAARKIDSLKGARPRRCRPSNCSPGCRSCRSRHGATSRVSRWMTAAWPSIYHAASLPFAPKPT